MRVIIAFILLLSFNFYAQIPDNVISELTANHVPVLNTKFSIIPPKGFQMEPLVRGFVKESRQIAYIEMLTVHSSFKKRISIESFKEFGENIKIDHFKFNNKDAIWVSYESLEYPDIKRQKHILYVSFNKENMLAIVSDYQMTVKKEVEEEVIKSMLSTVYLPEKRYVFSEKAGGDFNIAKYGLQESRDSVYPNDIAFIGNGKEGKLSSTNIYAAIKHDYLIKGYSTEYKKIDKKEYSLTYGKKRTKLEEPISINPIKVDGLNGYELEYQKKDEKGNIKNMYFITLLFRGDTYYALEGGSRSVNIMKKELKYYKENFKELFYTFKQK
ncbi:hypothetical protein [Tenacibaculum sp. M341]|uniref:hypothetical protein n=1 Tax=Tenacibaculum sp. M341 TaxID=2530339 RepID=UPI001046F2D8|nr:hypothetical protein [Tenacibaculum sp. M341]TCI91836.1 hypothetical protein EYW44_09795 [Tenacibaculum sp. M341]